MNIQSSSKSKVFILVAAMATSSLSGCSCTRQGPTSAAGGSDVTAAIDADDEVGSDQVTAPADASATDIPSLADALTSDVPTDAPKPDVQADAQPDVPFDPNKGMPPGFSWKYIPPMPTARYLATAVWGGGYLYVYGGLSKFQANCCNDPKAVPPNSNGLEAALERFDPKTQKWQSLPKPPVYPDLGSRFVFGGDHLYVYGTHDPNLNMTGPTPWADKPVTAAAYDLAKGTWSPLPTANSPGQRWFTTALWTGKVLLVFGNFKKAPAAPGAAYDPTSATWTPLPKLPTPAAEEDGWYYAVWNGERAFYFGPKVNLEYDPLTGTWTVFPQGPPQIAVGTAYSRSVEAAAPIKNGVILMTKQDIGPYEFWVHKSGTQTFEPVAIPKELTPKSTWTPDFIFSNGTPCWTDFSGGVPGGGACLEPTAGNWVTITKPFQGGGWDGFAVAPDSSGAALIGGDADDAAYGSAYVVGDGFYLALPKGGFQ